MFVQVIKGRTSDADGLRRQDERWRAELRSGAKGFLGSTFGAWFTRPANLDHVHGRGRVYVAELAAGQTVVFRGEPMTVETAAASVPPAERREVRVLDESRWYFGRSVRMEGVRHPVGLLILWRQRFSSWRTNCRPESKQRRPPGRHNWHDEGWSQQQLLWLL